MNIVKSILSPSLIITLILLCRIKEISLSNQVVCGKESKVYSKNEITKDAVEEAFRISGEAVKRKHDLEIKLIKKGRVITRNERTISSTLFSSRQYQFLRAKEDAQYIFLEASDFLHKRFRLSRNLHCFNQLSSLDGVLSSQIRENCKRITASAECDASSPYRTADGQCNNLQNPSWGSSNACQQRLLPARYVGSSGFRQSVKGGPLPPPRTLSLNLHYHLKRPTKHANHMYMFFGQLLDHDITLTPVTTTAQNESIQCCPLSNETHPQCAPIILTEDDPFYSQFGIRCLNFVRSSICPTCTLGPRRQRIDVTSFIDASFVYGNSRNETDNLRTNDGTGRLKVQNSPYGDLLPPSSNPNNDLCSNPEEDEICFLAGDPRANQNPTLTVLHTVFLREHNRIASRLREINPHWGEEKLFQEARRVVGAEMQTITYKEFLPITLGKDMMSQYHLFMGKSTRYDETQNPTMILEFTTAAFRFGHSLVNSVISDKPLNSTGGVHLLRDVFFQPFDLYNGYVGLFLTGASKVPAQQFDNHMVPDTTNYLYRIRGNETGLDLAAINICRGRDHGIPNYVDMVRFCSNKKTAIRKFSDLVSYRLMKREHTDALRQNYKSVKDVDLWPGILMEIPIKGAVVGPTAACLIGIQFQKLKFGDRFYAEHENQKGSFTPQQLQELRRVTLSKIFCFTTKISKLPSKVMLFKSEKNPMIDCSKVRGIDLSSWKELKSAS